MSLSTSSTFNSTYLNVTNDFFPPVWASSTSIGNSILYLSLYSIYMVAFVVLFSRINQRIKTANENAKAKSRNKVIKRNHIVIFALVLILVLVEMINLILRIVGDGLSLSARMKLDSNMLVLTTEYLAIWIVNGFATLFMYSNYIMLFLIMFVVQMIFWRTAMVMRSISKVAFKRIKEISTAVIIISAILILTCNIFLTITLPLTKMELINNNAFAIPNFILLLIVAVLFVKDTVVVLISGFMVIRTIKKSIEKNNKSKGDKLENPFIVIVSLMMGLVMCILLQLFAGILAAALLSTELKYIKFVWHFFNGLGIITFAILNLCLFYPLFVQTQIVFEELHIDDTKSSVSTGQTASQVQSPHSPRKEEKKDVVEDINSASFPNRSV